MEKRALGKVALDLSGHQYLVNFLRMNMAQDVHSKKRIYKRKISFFKKNVIKWVVIVF